MQPTSVLLLVSTLLSQICGAAANGNQTTAPMPLALPPPALDPPPPAAAPDGNTSCTFDSVNDLVDRVVQDWAGRNISQLVDTCPDVCELVYGTGNPDTSGIGAMSSYALQGVSALFFGPILAILVLQAGADPISDSFLKLPAKLWVSDTFVPVAKRVHGTNVFIAFSVLFATLIRVRQACPVAERNFLQHLAAYEVLIAVICTVSYLPLHESSRLKKMAMVAYVVGTIIMVFIARDWTGLGAEPHASTFEALTKYCVQQHDWPVPEISFASPSSPEPLPSGGNPWTWRQTLILVTSPVWLIPAWFVMFVLFCVAVGTLTVVGIIVFGVLYVIVMTVIVLTKELAQSGPYEAVCERLGVGQKRLGAIIVTACLTGLAAGLVWTMFRAMLVQRDELRAVSGSAYQDNDWGFGQVTALLAWFPTTLDTAFAVIEASRCHQAKPSNPQTSLTEDGLEALSLHVVGQGLQGHIEPSSVPASQTTASAAALRYRPLANQRPAVRNGPTPAAGLSSPSTQADPRWGLPPPGLARTSSIDVQAAAVRARPPRPRNDRGIYFSSRG